MQTAYKFRDPKLASGALLRLIRACLYPLIFGACVALPLSPAQSQSQQNWQKTTTTKTAPANKNNDWSPVTAPQSPPPPPARPAPKKRPVAKPAPTKPRKKTRSAAVPLVPVTLSALITEGSSKINKGVVWRIFNSAQQKGGKHRLITTLRNANPTAALPPGEYLINAAYGRAHLTKKITVTKGTSLEEKFILNSGGLRLSALQANGQILPNSSVSFTIYSDERDQFSNRKKIMNNAKPGLVIRLNGGIYHIVSRYGTANAVVSSDITVEPGKLSEATIVHSAAKITFKLVLQPGGEALANTRWSLLTENGDVVKESAGALPTHILAAGRYIILARYKGKNFKRNFEAMPGEIKQVEVVIQ